MIRKSPTYLFILILICFLPDQVFSQRLTTKLADKSFEGFAYAEAIRLYEYAYQKDTSDNYVVKRLADANRIIGNTKQVELWLNKLIDRQAQLPEDIFNYSQALKSNGKYLLAEFWLKQYASLKPDDRRLNLQVSLLQYIKLLMRDSANYEIRNVSLNTQGSDLGPAFYKDQLIFSSTSIGFKSGDNYRWNDLPYLHMYSAQIDASTGDLTSPIPFAIKLKTNYHDGPVSFDQKKDLIYFTRNNFVKGKTSKSKEGVVNLKIFTGKFENGEWKLTGGFDYNSNEYSVGHPAIDRTGTILYFASDMPGGYGKSDLYYSILSNGQWSKPINLGPKINTEGNEFFPFISNDGVLYFASDGHGGLGGLDIFFSLPEQGIIFNTIQNMGYPVNSGKDDFGLALDSTGMRGYFSSNRLGGKGDDDLYFLKIKRIPVIIRGVIKDSNTKEFLSDATVSLLDENGQAIQTSLTRNDGQFEFEVNKGQQYTLKGMKESYSDNQTKVSTSDLHPNEVVLSEIFLEHQVEVQVDHSPTPINMEEENGVPLQVIELEYINYDLDKWNIRPDAAKILDRLVGTMKQFPDLEIRIESHTDSRGSDEYNLQLSKKRARAAFDYVVSKGIDPDRMIQQGYGETRLLNKCGNGVPCDEAQHEVNRRSIVKVVRKGNYKEKREQKSIPYL
jgi:outer membrane protein OmpA-like peptidoglycan-associated protein